jgi:pimeloyl-ACP methyl ester carboxylesterase
VLDDLFARHGKDFRKTVHDPQIAAQAEPELIARRFDEEGMAKVAEFYSRGPTRVQFIDKDPRGWQEFHDRLAAGSARGHALTLRGVQMSRPSVFDLGEAMATCDVPALIMTGDEDEPCLEPGIFMKRKIPTAGLVVLPKSGHAINLEEPDAQPRRAEFRPWWTQAAGRGGPASMTIPASCPPAPGLVARRRVGRNRPETADRLDCPILGP